MIRFIRNKKVSKLIACTIAVNILTQCLMPTVAFALTGGPSQPEVQSFEPIGTSQMVEPFSGDFNYNIPLIDVGGYPINLSYHSGISMDQEASWVGLGWNINPGVINRNMRGIPDDFNGDNISKEFNMRPNVTLGINVSTEIKDIEVFGFKPSDYISSSTFNLGLGAGIRFNNYYGISAEIQASPEIGSNDCNKYSGTLGLGISSGSESGLGITPQVSFSKRTEESSGRDVTPTINIGLPYNSRAGLQAMTISTDVQRQSKRSHDYNFYIQGKQYKGYYHENKSGGWENHPMNAAGNGGSSLSFAGETFVPKLSSPMTNSSFALKFHVGIDIYGTEMNTIWRAYYSEQRLSKKHQNIPAYGYLNLENGQYQDEVMMDFNREKDGAFTEHTPSLPLTNLTYDLYAVSGQGIGGTYRPYRSDVGYVFDSKVKNSTGNIDFPGVELGGGAGFHPGLNFSANYSDATSGKWKDGNNAMNRLAYKSGTVRLWNKLFGTQTLYEPYYFKQVGEKVVESDEDMFNKYGGFDPVQIALANSPQDAQALPYFYSSSGTLDIPLNNMRNKRAKRNEDLALLNADQANFAAKSKYIEVYGIKDDVDRFAFGQDGPFKGRYKPVEFIDRRSDGRGSNHISEITTYRADGARYVYGIPAYNYVEKDATFSISGGYRNCSTGQITYEEGKDNSVENQSGLDEYFERTTTPPYAHSYMLTHVLSADYVDITGDGPTVDDLGTFTKINYCKSLINESGDPKDKNNYLYKWRVPYNENFANYSEGFKSYRFDDNMMGDDKASYIYGEKELWYIHSIETRSHVAEFVTLTREDGCGVKGENGGFSLSESNRMRKLEKIVLYAREDKIKNGTNAIPIKTVNFVYDYSLCSGIDNSYTITDGTKNTDKGKLTLKTVYFTYGKSQKSALSPYRFTYSEVRSKNTTGPDGYANNSYPINNPNYNLKAYDRWGNYKANNFSDCDDIYGDFSTAEFPYVCQGKYTSGSYSGMYEADVNATAWQLSSIVLPSGGLINVSYESDDYAYVQDKRPMQMFKVEGATNTDPANITEESQFLSNLYETGTNKYSHNYLIFKLQEPLPSSTPAATVKKLYCNEKDGTQMPYLYFRFLVNLKKLMKNKFEYVPGYAKLTGECGLLTANTTFLRTVEGACKYGWVKIKQASSDPGDDDYPYNAISKASWNFMRMQLPRIAYNKDADQDVGLGGVNYDPTIAVFKTLVSTFDELYSVMRGFDNKMRDFGNGWEFSKNKSFIRLFNPYNNKKGGGSRVRKIVINDNWKLLLDNNSNYESFSYGQEYEYKTIDEYGDPISSGVASYEPMMGGDENPFRQPDFFNEKKILAPDDQFYKEFPYGESFFPSPSVGYSKVTIKNLNRGSDVSSNATGKTVSEFYTARDFPTLPKRTGLQVLRYKPLWNLFGIYSQDYLTASQGFVVELNDMHGKPKANWVYAENKEEPISGVEYKYKLSAPNRINNNFTTIDKHKNIKENQVGVDMDIVADMREQSTYSHTGGLGGNLDAFLAFVLPVAIPVVLPSYTQEKVQFRSAGITKIINRYGILENTIAYDLGAQISTQNKMLDAETGEVLLTKTSNAFDDPVYHFTYPAHWSYDGMGQSYKNIGYSQDKNFNVDAIDLELKYDNEFIFFPGDEILFNYVDAFGEDNSDLGWIDINESTGARKIITRGGIEVKINEDAVSYVKIIRSGRRNQQSFPIGEITSLSDPVHFDAAINKSNLFFEKVTGANATEYAENWSIFCECEIKPRMYFNPYHRGTKGMWRKKKTWAFLTNRTQSRMNENTNIRKDGVYESFAPFWDYNALATWVPTDDSRWQFVNDITLYSPYGFELENADPLNRYSSATYGYYDALPTAVSTNAQYNEIGYDGFEDYDYTRCIDDHFSYKKPLYDLGITPPPVNINLMKSHTGRRSLRLDKGANIELTKKIRKTGAGCTTTPCINEVCD